MIKRFWHSSNAQYSPEFIRGIVNQYGKDILIGGDPGYGQDFWLAMKTAAELGAQRHVYLVGPGMMEWSQEERDEIAANARSVGLDTDSSNWQDQWFNEGKWKLKVFDWFSTFSKGGFYSAEIDNIDAALHNDPTDLATFYCELYEYCSKNHLAIRLMVKNLSEDELAKVIEWAPFWAGFFAPFGMFEDGTGDPKEQIRLAAKLGIRAVTPINGLKDTHHYGTSDKGIPW